MKVITREIKIHTYTFGRYDVATGQVRDSFTVSRPKPLTRGEIKEITAENKGALMVHRDITPTRYTMPVEDYIKACEQYAARVAAGEAEAIPDGAIEDDSDIENEDEEG